MGLMQSTIKRFGVFFVKCKKYLPRENRAVLFCKEAYYGIRHGCSPDDFFRYEFYRKSDYERKNFITYRRSQRIIRQYNAKQHTEVFTDKCRFHQVFSAYSRRDYIDLSAASQEDFKSFIQKHGSVIMKPARGGQGKGIFKLSLDEADGYAVEDYRSYICEQLLIQHPHMSRLNPSSVNTVRVLTFRGEIVACALRTGGGGDIVDNLHASGVCAHLDIESGIIDAPCIDNTLHKHLHHPYTGILLPGFKVPHWNLVLETAKAAAKEIPDVQYVGWDMAILEDGVAIIEGNSDPGHDVVQMIVQEGLYGKIREIARRK